MDSLGYGKYYPLHLCLSLLVAPPLLRSSASRLVFERCGHLGGLRGLCTAHLTQHRLCDVARLRAHLS